SPFIGLHDVRMAERDGDLPLAGLLEFGGKAGFELARLFLVEHLERHDLARKRVARAPDPRHAPLPHAANEVKALGDVGPGDLPGLENVFEEVEFHAARCLAPRSKAVKESNPRDVPIEKALPEFDSLTASPRPAPLFYAVVDDAGNLAPQLRPRH